jgi:hypothetical protein
MTAHRLIPLALVGIGASAMAGGENPLVFPDPADDAVLRRTDDGNDGAMDPGAVLPEMLELRVGAWAPDDPAVDPYTGHWDNDDVYELLRIDVVFAGLVNPPGNILGTQPFNPFRFGPSPLHGFVELDVDDREDSGGECDDAALFRYLAIVGRLGAAPYGSIAERVAHEEADLDQVFGSHPQYERSGAEFVVSFCGCFNVTLTNANGDLTPASFDAGDTWIVRGRFFQRSAGFQDGCASSGGSFPGLYDPWVFARFSHDEGTDQTTVSLVYGLTNAGAASLTGQTPQNIDLNAANQTSVQEGLEDVIVAAEDDYPPGCLYEIIRDWEGRDSEDYLDPSDWRVTALFGTTYTTLQPPHYYVWTDSGVDDRVGDFDGSGEVTPMDGGAVTDEIAARDGSASDADGQVNGAVVIPAFASDFSIFDVTGDGAISGDDIDALGLGLLGDLTGDCVIDFKDLNLVVSFFSTNDPAGDADGDGLVDFTDLNIVLSGYNTTCADLPRSAGARRE